MLRNRLTAYRPSLSKLLVVVFGALLVALPIEGNASALSGSEFKAGSIISDSIFFNNSAMTSTQIQNFLNSKVPVCDTSGTQTVSAGTTRAQYGTAHGYPPPYTCLKDYTQDTPNRPAENGLCNAYAGGPHKSSTEIIYDISQICGINPQVLLVLLQKEQSLVTDDWPWANQYQSATGFGCPDTAACDTSYSGFFNQVYNAARIYKRYARDADLFNFHAGRNNQVYYNPNASCGASNVFIQNQATADLYIYTPYQPNAAALANLYGTGDSCSAYGNRNFWRMFSDWFGNTQGSQLVRTPSNPTYYLLTGGVKYAIPNGDILYAYGIQNMRLDVVSDNYLGSVTDGGTLGTLFTVINDPTVYLADNGNKIGISSGTYCTRWGLPCGDANAKKNVGLEIASTMGNGGILHEVMANQGNYYLMENGNKRPFLSEKALNENGYNGANVNVIGSWTNAIRPFGTSLPQNNSFVQFAKNGAIYLYSGGSFYAIPDYETYLSWRGTSNPLMIDGNSAYNITPPTASMVLSTLISNGGDKFLIDGGRRISLTTASSAWPTGMNTTSLNSMLGTLPTVNGVTADSPFRITNGTIYRTISQQKRPFASLYDYQTLNASPLVQLNTTSIPIAQGAALLAEGSAYKISGGDSIYFVGKDSKSYAFLNLKQITDFVTNQPIPTLSPSDAAQFSYQTTLSAHVIDSAGKHYVINNGKRHPVNAAEVTNWGFPVVAAPIVSDSYLNRLPVGQAVSSFIVHPNGTIYAISSGNKRPIASYQRYLSLGGRDSNTLALPAEVVDSLPTGAVIP